MAEIARLERANPRINILLRTKIWLSEAATALRPEHAFALFAFVTALFLLLSTTHFSLKGGTTTVALALISTVPLGALLVKWLLPDVESQSVRLALTLQSGLAASIWMGFFLGVAGAQWLYLPVCFAFFAVWLGVLYRDVRAETRSGRSWSEAMGLERMVQSRAVWVVAAIGFLSVAVTTPLMSPLVQVSTNLFIDYAHLDAHFYMNLAQMFTFGAPLAVWPDLAGTRPLIYPDFYSFWMGQLTSWARVDVRDVYFINVQIVQTAFEVVLLYAIGKELTGSRWGGFIAAALAYVVLIPNPYDSNLLLRNVDSWPDQPVLRMHYQGLRSNPAIPAGWQLVSGVFLALLALRHSRSEHSAIGLLSMGSLLLVLLLRIRSNFFVVAAPPFALILLWLAVRRREWRYLVPLGVMAALGAPMLWESMRGYYDMGTAASAILYGPYGESVLNRLPMGLNSILPELPALARPLLGELAYVTLRLFGVAYSAVLLIWAVLSLRRRGRLNLAQVYLLAVLLSALVAASLIVKPLYIGIGGDWGTQALGILLRVALLLVIVPLFRFLRYLGQKVAGANQNRSALALGVLAFASVVAYRGADANLHEMTNRGYPLASAELDAYYWIQHNTPSLAVVAANADHRVNPAGETVGKTSFLGAMSERPVYLQRQFLYNVEEQDRRQGVLKRLFSTSSVEEARQLVETENFDYLLVYPDTPPNLDLSCCMSLVWSGTPQVYHVTRR